MEIKRKICNSCGEAKPLDKFSMKISGRRLEDICIKCLEQSLRPKKIPKTAGYSNIPPRLGNKTINQRELKRCGTCGELQLLRNFSVDNSTADGLRSYCRTCAGRHHKKHITTRALILWEKEIRSYAAKQNWFTAKDIKKLIKYNITSTREYLNFLSREGFLETRTNKWRKYYRLPVEDLITDKREMV